MVTEEVKAILTSDVSNYVANMKTASTSAKGFSEAENALVAHMRANAKAGGEASYRFAEQVKNNLKTATASTESFISSQRKLKNALSHGITGVALSGGSIESVIGSLGMLVKATTLGVGGFVAIAAGAAIFTKLSERAKAAKEEAEKLADAYRKLTKESAQLSSFSGVGALDKHAGALSDEREALEKHAGTVSRRSTEGGLTANRLDAVNSQSVKVHEDIIAAYEREASLAETLAGQSADDAAFTKLRAEREKQLAENKHGDVGRDSINRQFDAQESSLSRQNDLKKNSLDLELHIQRIKESGLNVEERTAEARIASAKRARDMSIGGDAKAAQNGIIEAQTAAAENARRAKDAKESELSIQREIADMVASTDLKHLAQLRLEISESERKLNNAKPDEAAAAETELQTKRAQLRDSQKGYAQKLGESLSGEVAARFKLGTKSETERKAVDIGSELGTLNGRLKDTNDPAEQSQIRAQIIGKQLQLSELRDSITQSTTTGGVSSLARIGGGGGVGGGGGNTLVARVDTLVKWMEKVAEYTKKTSENKNGLYLPA